MKREEEDFNDKKFLGNRKQNSFKVPEGYFEKLPLKIQSRIIESTRLSFWERIQMVISAISPYRLAAGMALVVLFIGLGILLNTGKDSVEERTVAINEKSILDKNLDSMVKEVAKEDIKVADLEPIEQALIMEEIQPEAISPASSVKVDSGKVAMNSSEEINYLLENDIDVSLIIDELNRD